MVIKRYRKICGETMVTRRSADLGANLMQVSSREISEAWHIKNECEARSCFNLSCSVSSEMIRCGLFSPYLGRELQMYVNVVNT